MHRLQCKKTTSLVYFLSSIPISQSMELSHLCKSQACQQSITTEKQINPYFTIRTTPVCIQTCLLIQNEYLRPHLRRCEASRVVWCLAARRTFFSVRGGKAAMPAAAPAANLQTCSEACGRHHCGARCPPRERATWDASMPSASSAAKNAPYQANACKIASISPRMVRGSSLFKQEMVHHEWGISSSSHSCADRLDIADWLALHSWHDRRTMEEQHFHHQKNLIPPFAIHFYENCRWLLTFYNENSLHNIYFNKVPLQCNAHT